MGFEIVTEQGRTRDFTATLKTASGGYLQLAAEDVVRMKVGRGGSSVLDLDSVADTASGSGITVDQLGDGASTHCSVTIRLAQGDVESLKGMYQAEIDVVDESSVSPSNALLPVDRGSVSVVAMELDGDEELA
jgi:hypothetical protein